MGGFIAAAVLTTIRIPFERALDFANKEKITELLYPLFVHNIGALLYHPTNQTRTNAVMAAAERRKQEQNQMRTQPPGLPSLHQHHHHSMNPSGGHLPGPHNSLVPHPSVGRPGLDRAHTFPTPPTSASSVMGNMGSSDGSFQWGPQGTMGSVQGTNPLSIDTGLSNARSMPTTPATTPPGTSIQSMQQYQQSSQPYDSSRQMYSAAPTQQNSYSQSAPSQQNMAPYSQPNSYIKNEMGPPSARAPGSEPEHHDGSKDANGILHHNQGNGQVNHSQEDEGNHEHDPEYTHDSSTSYNTSRQSYTYNNGTTVGSLSGEHAHLSPEMTGSPNHTASGRATPRTASAPQPYYGQQGGYSTPPRVQPPSSNLYNVMSSERGTANGSAGGDVYSSDISNGYPSQQTVMNGAPTGNKRGRDDDDDGRPPSQGPGGVADVDGLKRRKTIREGSVSGPTYEPSLNRARSTIIQRRR